METKRKNAAASSPPDQLPASPPPSPLAKLSADAGGLASRKQAALLALASGQGFAKAAESAGVSRQTLYEWRRSDHSFAALLNAWEADTKASGQHRLLGMVEDALGNVQSAISSGDKRVSLEVLCRLGVLTAVATKETNPKVLEQQAFAAEAKRKHEREIQEMIIATNKLLAGSRPEE